MNESSSHSGVRFVVKIQPSKHLGNALQTFFGPSEESVGHEVKMNPVLLFHDSRTKYLVQYHFERVFHIVLLFRHLLFQFIERQSISKLNNTYSKI